MIKEFDIGLARDEMSVKKLYGLSLGLYGIGYQIRQCIVMYVGYKHTVYF